jgi:hypothetical protein
MSIEAVQNAWLDLFQKDTACDAAFAKALSGHATSSGTSVTGDASTKFTTELVVGDYIGTTAKGYRKVTAITDAQHLTVASAFDTALSDEDIKVTQIRKGGAKLEQLTKVGKTLRIIFSTAGDDDKDATGQIVKSVLGFIVQVAFMEPDEERAESRKSAYHKMLLDLIDTNPTAKGTVIGTTRTALMNFREHVRTEGTYIGTLTLICERKEMRGSR